MSDRGVRDSGRVDARTFLAFILAPEEADRSALEDDKKEVEEGESDDHS